LRAVFVLFGLLGIAQSLKKCCKMGLRDRKTVYYLLLLKIKPKILDEMERFSQLRDLVNSLQEDFTKFYDKGNKAAGTRVRKGMQELKNLAQDIRVEVQNSKNED
jgi:hypothetical protein